MPAEDDPELALQEALSGLATRTQAEVGSCLEDLLRPPTTEQNKLDSLNEILLQTSSLIESPFDLHAVVVQSMVFMRDGNPNEEDPDALARDGCYRLCCIVLMARALQRCPDPLTKRFKRWTSILCEAISYYQTFLDDFEEDQSELSLLRFMVRTWWEQLLPAGWTVLEQINSSDSSLESPIVSAFVGISTCLAAAVSRTSESAVDVPTLAALASRFEAHVRTSLEEVLYTYPIWKENDNLESDSIERWAITTGSLDDDRFCRIHTSWNDFGVTLLLLQPLGETIAMDSNLSTSPATWMCHAQTLLENGMWKEGLKLLDSKGLANDSEPYPSNMSPAVVSTIELLCNYLWNAALTKQAPSVASSTYLLMQRMIQKCLPVEQVRIVERLIEKCPYPGLVPKLFDLWRGLLVSGEQPPPALLWELLDGRLELLAAQVERAAQAAKAENEQYETLLSNYLMVDLESHVSVLTMMQVYVLQHKQRPPCCHHLSSLARTASILSSFSRDTLADGYRLDLLQDALTRLLQCLDALE